MTPITKIDFSIHDLIVHDVKIPKGIKNTVVGIYEVGNKPGYVLKGNLYGKNIILLDTDFDKEFEDEFTSILFENMFLFCEKNHFSSKYMNLLGHSHIFRNMENMKIYSYVFETKKNLPKYTMISGTEKYGYSLFNVTKKIGKITLDEEYDSFAGSFYPANSYFYEHPLVGIDLNRDGVFEKDEIFYHCEKINVNGNIFKLKEVKPSGSDGIKIDYEKLTEEIEENSVKNKLEFIMNNGEFRDSGKPKIVFYSANKDEYYEFWIKKLEKTKKELDIDVVVLSSIFDFDTISKVEEINFKERKGLYYSDINMETANRYLLHEALKFTDLYILNSQNEIVYSSKQNLLIENEYIWDWNGEINILSPEYISKIMEEMVK